MTQQIKLADYFVIVSGQSRPQIKAIGQDLRARLKAAGVVPARIEGTDLGWWVLMDYGDVIVHLMQPESREYYDLDGLYGECKEIDWRAAAMPDLPQPEAAKSAE